MRWRVGRRPRCATARGRGTGWWRLRTLWVLEGGGHRWKLEQWGGVRGRPWCDFPGRSPRQREALVLSIENIYFGVRLWHQEKGRIVGTVQRKVVPAAWLHGGAELGTQPRAAAEQRRLVWIAARARVQCRVCFVARSVGAWQRASGTHWKKPHLHLASHVTSWCSFLLAQAARVLSTAEDWVGARPVRWKPLRRTRGEVCLLCRKRERRCRAVVLLCILRETCIYSVRGANLRELLGLLCTEQQQTRAFWHPSTTLREQ